MLFKIHTAGLGVAEFFLDMCLARNAPMKCCHSIRKWNLFLQVRIPVLCLLGVLILGRAPIQGALRDLYVSGTFSFPETSVKRFDGFTGVSVGTNATYASGGGLSFPRGLDFGPDGTLYVASEGTNSILGFIAGTGAFAAEIVAAGAGSSPGVDGLTAPKGVRLGLDGNLYVASNGSPNRILKFDPGSGAFLADLTMAVPGLITFGGIWGLAFGPDGLLYASGASTGNILRFDPGSASFSSEFVVPFAGGLANPHGLTFGPDGHLYVAGGETDGRVWKFDGVTGASLGLFVTLADNGGLSRPDGITFGPDGNLYVSSSDTNNVLRYSGTSGAFLDVFAALGFPLSFGPGDLSFYPVPEPSPWIVTLCIVIFGRAANLTNLSRYNSFKDCNEPYTSP